MIENYIEAMIRQAQKSGGLIVFDDRNDIRIESILSSMAKDKLLSYELIFQDEKGRWLLNQKGRNFKSFEHENRKEALEAEKFKVDVANAKRVYKTYHSTRVIMWITFVISIVLSVLKLAEELKVWLDHK